MSEHAEPTSFWSKYVFSFDHKVIGLQYYFTAMAVALLGGTFALLIRMQIAWPTYSGTFLETLLPEALRGGVMKPEFYLMMVTMHGTLMVFFVISNALVSGFGNYLIPLQVGARDMAYPLLNMLSYWVMMVGLFIMVASFFVEGGAASAAWWAYPPLSALKEAIPGSGAGQTLWLIAMAFFVISFTMGGLNYVVTVLNLRVSGLTLMRMPMTVWTLFLAAILGLLAFPAATAAVVMLLFDREVGTSFFVPSDVILGETVMAHAGGTPILYQHLFWFMAHPEVYVLLLPALGVALDVLSPFTQRPVFGRKVIIYALWIIGALSMIVWGHHMFISGMNPFLGEAFALGTLAITVPFTVIAVCMLAGLWGARFRFDTPLLFALGIISLVGTGGLGGLFLGNALSDMFLHDSFFVVGHFHFMIGWVTLFGIFAGTYYWFPKMFGRTMNEAMGKIHFWLSFLGVYAVFLPMHFLGYSGQPRHYYDFTTYEFLQSLVPLNKMITVAAIVLFLGQMVFLVNFFLSLFKGKKVEEENPWGATTLEWTTPTPPGHGNWPAEVPVVYRDPYDYQEADDTFLPQHQADPA